MGSGPRRNGISLACRQQAVEIGSQTQGFLHDLTLGEKMIRDTRQSGCIVMTSTWYILGLEQQIFYVATLSRPITMQSMPLHMWVAMLAVCAVTQWGSMDYPLVCEDSHLMASVPLLPWQFGNFGMSLYEMATLGLFESRFSASCPSPVPQMIPISGRISVFPWINFAIASTSL